MLLAVDIGNTTICFGGLEKDAGGEYTLRFALRTDTRRKQSGEEYLRILRGLLAETGTAPDSFEGAVLSSVVPCLDEALLSCAREITGTEPLVIGSESRLGLTIGVPEPEKVGRDRLVDAAWAASRFPLPVVTVDMGTATTFNVVDENRVFLGGVIAPGLATGLDALIGKAAQLPEIALFAPGRVIGRTTAECMRSGAVLGAAAMIDGIVQRIEAELGKPVSLVLTGGLARHVEKLCTHPHVYDPALLLKGLALLYEENCEK